MKVPPALTFGVLVLAAAGSWWIGRRDDAAGPAQPSSDQPGYYLRDATVEQSDGSGRIDVRVHAATAQQEQSGGPVSLADLRVEYEPEAGRTWLMTAAGGTLPPGGRTVLLAGDVHLISPPDPRGTAVARTARLRVDVDAELATTSDPVRIEMSGHWVDARGMRADFKHETLRLESSVHGTFNR